MAGPSRRKGNSVGEHLCSDLTCSLCLPGKRQARMSLVRYEETPSLETRIERAMRKLYAFVRRIAVV
ncbi:FBP domain-containing protein [Streptomyces canus]|uniref:FBP domain-containing protein n=1 Tax=Streptomyces canus TaxID=58343 RepID=UPI0039A4B101